MTSEFKFLILSGLSILGLVVAIASTSTSNENLCNGELRTYIGRYIPMMVGGALIMLPTYETFCQEKTNDK